ncbi:MAG: phospho-N-acetylmuramoyl-pentapeptide-transferase [Bacilli bacterium]|nr:phospho-N-acetylmuramoyl-pentapeptide-transferase [Bacilli bacterium]
MLILAKAAMAMMLGFVLSIIMGLILIPLLKKFHIGQNVSHTINKRHLKKEGTPTMGGLIFIIPTLLALAFLYFRGSIELSHNLFILIFVFLAYALLGFADDFLKVKFHNNKGISITTKFLIQMVIALIFFYVFMKNGGDSTLEFTFLNIEIPLGWTFGIFILLVLVGSSNAVNITDGLDGLAGGLSAIAFLAFGIIAWNTGWMEGYQEVAIFSFVLVGSLLGFLVFNSHPAKVFMGDLGSLSLGAALATIAILTRHEMSLVLIGGVFVVETLSSLIQLIAILKFKKKVFKKAPLHHHFEELGWAEQDIVKLFYVVGLLLAMAAITYGVWL